MAWQRGILFLSGTMGGLTFCRNGVVRKARRSDKAHFHSAPSLARTRENATEFGRASSAAKLLRDALRGPLAGRQTLAMVSGLTRVMRVVLGRDTVHGRGERQVLADHLGHLQGFRFGQGAALPGQWPGGQRVTVSTAGVVRVTLPALDMRRDLTAPGGATHVGVEAHIVVLDFAAGTSWVLARAGGAGLQPLGAGVLPGAVVSGALPGGLTGSEALVVVVGLAFYQEVSGELVLVGLAAGRALEVVYAGPLGDVLVVAGAGLAGRGAARVGRTVQQSGALRGPGRRRVTGGALRGYPRVVVESIHAPPAE